MADAIDAGGGSGAIGAGTGDDAAGVSWQEFSFSSGVKMAITRHFCPDNQVLKDVELAPVLGFSFCLTGSASCQRPGSLEDLSLDGGEFATFCLPEQTASYSFRPGESHLSLCIWLEPERFSGFLQESPGRLPQDLQTAIENCQSHQFQSKKSMTPRMSRAIRELLLLPGTGLGHALYLEAKTLELMAHVLEDLEPPRNGSATKKRLAREDIDKIRLVGDLMVKNMADPPDIGTLARQVGMSRSKLLSCFARVYGCPPSEYLRCRRMEEAKRILEAGGRNVTEVAFLVGYSSSSHFTKAFRHYFGTLPSRLVR